MPAFRVGRVGVTVGAILVGLACGLPPGAAFAEPSDSGSDSSSSAGDSELSGPNSGTDAAARETPTRVGPNASDDDITKAIAAEDNAWRDAEAAVDMNQRGLMEELRGLSTLNRETAVRMRDEARAIQEAARTDEQAGLELLRLHEPEMASGFASGGTAIGPEVAGLSAQHKKSMADTDTALGDRAALIESMKLQAQGNESKMGAVAELQNEQNALSQLQTEQSAEFDRIMADAAKAEAEAASAGQGPIDEAAFINQMIARSADVRAKLQEITNAQTAALESFTRG